MMCEKTVGWASPTETCPSSPEMNRWRWLRWLVVAVSVVSCVIGYPTRAIALDLLPPPPSEVSSPAPTTNIQTISWAFTANRFRDRVGDDITLFCPAEGVANRVWGSDVYSDQSSICTAAVHAGLLTFEVGGAIAIRILPGQESYAGTTQNDLTSSSFGQWPGSFTFVTLRDAVAGVLSLQGTPGIPIQIGTWQSTAEAFSNQPNQLFALYCPAFGAVADVWGSDIYRDASSICTAAVHAGRITTQSGGTVAFTTVPAMP
ncbi:MAG: LCCL domain-containing protein, partial [Leptolyngbyaceae bacterium]|nr:LCCL domain-containing protein [Leptolyngbyaceae bacterium]